MRKLQGGETIDDSRLLEVREIKFALWSTFFNLARLEEHRHRIFFCKTSISGRAAMRIRRASQALTQLWSQATGIPYGDHVLVSLMVRYPEDEDSDCDSFEVSFSDPVLVASVHASQDRAHSPRRVPLKTRRNLLSHLPLVGVRMPEVVWKRTIPMKFCALLLLRLLHVL